MPRKKQNKILNKAAKDGFTETITKNPIKDDCFGKVPKEHNTLQTKKKKGLRNRILNRIFRLNKHIEASDKPQDNQIGKPKPKPSKRRIKTKNQPSSLEIKFQAFP